MSDFKKEMKRIRGLDTVSRNETLKLVELATQEGRFRTDTLQEQHVYNFDFTYNQDKSELAAGLCELARLLDDTDAADVLISAGARNVDGGYSIQVKFSR